MTANRTTIFKYEQIYGADPDTSENPDTPTSALAMVNSYLLNANPSIAAPVTPVQTLTAAFNSEAELITSYLNTNYSSVLPQIEIENDSNSAGGSFEVKSTDIFVAPTQNEINNGFASSSLLKVDAAAGDPGSNGSSEAANNHILIGTGSGDTLIGGSGKDILLAQTGNELLEVGAGADTLIAANGNDTVQLGVQTGSPVDVLDFVFPASSGSTETILANGSSGLGTLDVNGSALGGALVASGSNTDNWTDQNGNTYQFISSTNSLTGYSPGQNTQAVGEMVIALGGPGGNQIDIWGFNLTQAENLTSGFLGIHVPPTLSLTYAANAGVDPPAPDFTAGSTQSYTAWLDAPSTSAETITITLSGAPASDFGLVSGLSIVPINSNGTFTVTIAAGQTSAAFSLVNTGDVGAAANLQLVASMTNPNDSTGQAISSAPVTQSYVEPTLDPFVDNATTTVAGTSETDTVSGFNYTQYTGEDTVGSSDQMILSSGDNYVTENGENDFITESASGNNIILGSNTNSSNTILLNGTNNVAQAITQVTAGGAASGQLGDAVATGAGNDTIVGGNGNSVYLLGQGSNVVYTGAGNDSVVGGYVDPHAAAGTYSQQFNWTTSVTVASNQSLTYGSTTVEVPSSYTFLDSGIGANDLSSIVGSAAGSATVVAGNGNDFIGLPSGPGNYVVAGSGHDTIVGGDGGNTIFGGSGDSTILGGTGSDYIDTGTGSDLVADSGDGDTVIGGGNDTIALSSAGTGNNYVDGGAGSDVIFGSGGSDTLIAGDGNSTVLGGSGTESIVGGSGNDWLQGGTGNDTIEAGGGNDTLFADPNSSATTYLYGGTGTDSIVGGGGTDVLYAGDGGTSTAPTTVLGGAGSTTIYGGLGDAVIEGGSGTDVLYADDGGSDNTHRGEWAGNALWRRGRVNHGRMGVMRSAKTCRLT
ncbi:beta strand repeat-containing protein [Dyella nitratireducens]|uniref:beta strand repeat-containing protein n=2 Tax=Dyella nitratireducens TaxID=1849580 RepID=UPI003C30C86D